MGNDDEFEAQVLIESVEETTVWAYAYRFSLDDGLNFTYCDLDEGVRADVKTIRDSPLIPDEIPVSGYVYDVRTGRLRLVP